MNPGKIQLAYNQHADQRLQRTQNQLIATLMRYYDAQVEFAKISVSQLCRDAQLTRQTFYRHYGNIGEVVEVSCVRMLNQFLQRVDHTYDSSRVAAQLVVDVLDQQRSLLAVMFWSKVDEAVIQYITGDILRVYGFQDDQTRHKPFIAEMTARSIINFARLMLKQPQIVKADLVQLYTQMVPLPAVIFKD
ncbi:TetR/AcrR family transcriptional regulator [Loigolactobacillus zhaoyuanensis]|uniref:TetR/AcrR family transcriptional regulator n=1 Tax=Loigolactobacillus zhaoyuanensis TaxID=2486017 RepID=UPI000F7475D0|nr:TetR/AcrR family transcriptional regulator [Loigolactobacillus zhaoyuanensis]